MNMKDLFYRLNEKGNAVVLNSEDGSAVTKLAAYVYPVDSDLSVKYEHPNGIVLTVEDAERLGIEKE